MSPTPLPDLKRIERTPGGEDARMARWEAVLAVLLALVGVLLAAALIGATGGPQ